MQGPAWLGHHLGISDQMAVARLPLDVARNLLRLEAVLLAAGRLKPEWEQHWQVGMACSSLAAAPCLQAA